VAAGETDMDYIRKPKPSAASFQEDPEIVSIFRWKLPNGDNGTKNEVAYAKQHSPGFFRRMLGAIGEIKTKGSA
jgi:hypothetical protein